MTRTELVTKLWEDAKKRELADYHESPVCAAYNIFSGEWLKFERVTYGSSVVIEADGIIVERLCGTE